MKKLLVITSALFLTCAAAAAHADSVTYVVSVDTSSQKGNTGYIDMELNAGSLPAADVMATVSGFSGAALNPTDTNNYFWNVSGSPDSGSVTFDNQTGNDFYEALTFGDSLSFDVTLSGPGVSTTGSILSGSGTDFQLEFLDSSQSSFLLTDDPDGVAALIAIGNGGSASTAGSPLTSVAATPEPATLSLLALGGVAVGFARRWRTRVA